MSSTKNITLTVGGQDLDFKVDLADYTRFTNEMSLTNKVAPAKRLLKNTVATKQIDLLNKFINQGLAIEIAAALTDEYRPKVEIEVKKVNHLFERLKDSDNTLGQALVIARKWFPNREPDAECLAEAAFLEWDYWQKFKNSVTNGYVQAHKKG